jgi:hypothetical protein
MTQGKDAKMSGEERVVPIAAKRKASGAPPGPTGLAKVAALVEQRIQTAAAVAARREMGALIERVERLERLLALRPVE